MPLNPDLELAPDSALRRAALEAEQHVADSGWDQPPRLFALVSTGQLIAREPALAAQLGDAPGELTLIEQEGLPVDRPLEEVLTQIEWPDAVDGCAAVIERLMLPPHAEAALPDDPDEVFEAAAKHPDRQEVRLVAAVLRNGHSHSIVRVRTPETAGLLEGPDLVPALIGQLRDTLT